jgi:uncharacterized protein YndB with AHSA1/START domain
MASAERVIETDRESLWTAIADPRTYPDWLIGAKFIRAVDPAWPAPGTAFHHRVGFGPLVIDDRTTVIEVDPQRLLTLRIRATFAIQAIVRFELQDDADGTHVRFEEEPARRLLGNLVRPVMDPLTHSRNTASLRRLDQLLTGTIGHEPPDSAGPR